MALADFAGGVQDALAALVKQRLEQDELARRAQMEQARLSQADERLRLDRGRYDLDVKAAEDARRAQEEQQAFLRSLMEPEPAQVAPGSAEPMPSRGMPVAPGGGRLRTMLGTPEGRLSIMQRGGVRDPDELLPPQPAAPKRYQVTVRGPNGQPVQKLVTEDELAQGVTPFREPPKGEAPRRLWVVRNGQPAFVGENEIRPGDVPYEKGGGKNAGAAYADERATRTRDNAVALVDKVSAWTAGPGSMLAAIPGTEARNFQAELDTLKANIAFGEITEMREASKTGGALGQVSERELALLSSALGALDAGQSPENLKANLQKVVESLDRWQAAKGGGAQPMPSHGGGAVADPLGIRGGT